jgi:hypothetical protein
MNCLAGSKVAREIPGGADLVAENISPAKQASKITRIWRAVACFIKRLNSLSGKAS